MSDNKFGILGERLKFLREQWQQSIDEVCNALEIDEKTLRSFESGKIAPSAEMLDMLISHFLLTEDQAHDLRKLANYNNKDEVEDIISGVMDDVMNKQLVMFMPVDSRIVYTDSMQATVNDGGVVLQFMQQAGAGQPIPVSRVGMSREHAEKMVEVLKATLKHHDENGPKKLQPPENKD